MKPRRCPIPPRDPILEFMAERARVKSMLDAANGLALAIAREAPDEYPEAVEIAERWLGLYLDVCSAICRTSAATLEGAMARLEVACEIVLDVRSGENPDIDEVGMLGAFDDLRRLWQGRTA